MKKLLLTLALLLTLVVAFASCDGGNTGGNVGNNVGGSIPDGDNTPHTHAYGEWITVKEATETEDGKKVRVCACGEQETQSIPAKPSTPTPPAHTHNFNQKNATMEYRKSAATCTSAATYYYSCSCGEKGSATFTDGSMTSHAYNRKNTSSTYLKSAATENSPAYYYYSCTCGEKGSESFIHGDALVNTLAITYEPTPDYSFYVVTGVTGTGAVLEIPNLYDGLRVVGIADGAFEGNTTLRKITLPNTIETIGENAFRGCTALSEINLPEESVSSLGAYAFAGCTSLSGICIPSKVGYLPEGLFQGCTRLRSVTLVSGLKIVGDLAFDNCTALTSISLPDSVTSLGNMAFRHAEALASVKFSSGLTAIGNATFQYCKSLSSVELHSGITRLGNSAFSYCYGLKTLRILGEITSWGNSTFYECTALESVYLATGSSATVERQNYIFYNAGTAGKGITLSVRCNISILDILLTPNDDENLPKIASREYRHDYASGWTSDGESHWHKCQNSGCTSISDKSAHTVSTWVVAEYPTCTEKGVEHAVCAYCGEKCDERPIAVDPTAHDYTSGWTSDGESHWHKCQNSGCTSVKDKAPHTYSSIYSADATYIYRACTEKGCTATTSKTAHNMTFSVSGGNATLEGYEGSAASVVIPSTYNGDPVTSIGDRAFNNCSGLTSITIPDGVTSLGDYAFYNCSSLTYNEYGNAYYLGNADNPYLYLAKAKSTDVTSCTIHANTRFIGSYAFLSCSSLTSITIPSSVTSIGSYAFQDCSGLTSITIPSSVTSIGSYAFSGCNRLTYNAYGTAYYLGNADNPYLYLAKAKSQIVTSCTIHVNTRLIGSYAFSGCSQLTSITIPNSVTSIGDWAFAHCSNLTSITIPNSVTSIGSYAFYECRNLTSITIGNSVTSIGWSAFSYCDSLTSITIGNSVTSIGDYAFYYCKSLTSIRFNGTKAQWNAISKGSNWNYRTGAYKIYCTDGTLSK